MFSITLDYKACLTRSMVEQHATLACENDTVFVCFLNGVESALCYDKVAATNLFTMFSVVQKKLHKLEKKKPVEADEKDEDADEDDDSEDDTESRPLEVKVKCRSVAFLFFVSSP